MQAWLQYDSSVQFSCSVVSDSLQPHELQQYDKDPLKIRSVPRKKIHLNNCQTLFCYNTDWYFLFSHRFHTMPVGPWHGLSTYFMDIFSDPSGGILGGGQEVEPKPEFGCWLSVDCPEAHLPLPAVAVVQLLSRVRLCDPMDCSTPGFPVLHHLSEFAQTHVHWVGDAIQLSHPLSPASPPAFNLSQHRGLFQWVDFLNQIAKVLEFQHPVLPITVPASQDHHRNLMS